MPIRATVALLLLLPAAVFAQGQDLGTALSAVVRISGTRAGATVRGSGFVVGLEPGKATIVTASHVIEGVQQIEVTFAADRTESYPAGAVLGMESSNPRGLAVFQVRGALPEGLTTLSFSSENQSALGEDLYLLGFPQMAASPLALRRTFAGTDGNFLQLDQPTGEGISGAPVLRGGEVVGVVVEEDPQLTFAVRALVAQAAVLGWGARLGGQSSRPAPSPAVAECRPGEESTENGITYVRICPGTFTMGSGDNDPLAYENEKPAHQVTLRSESWLGKTEVTNAQYRRFAEDHPGDDKLPAVNVSWTDAKAACEAFGGRLPTEAEWEYAARAGTKTPWSFGDDEKRLGEFAWFGEGVDGAVHPVATKSPNPWGLHDMHGNAWEWVGDWFGPYIASAQTDAAGPAAGEYRVLRGGSFFDAARYLSSAILDWARPENRVRWVVGFRCVRGPRRQP